MVPRSPPRQEVNKPASVRASTSHYARPMEPISFTGGLIGLVIFVITVISIAKSDNHGVVGKAIWIVVAFFLSFVGSILWLIFGRGKKRR